MREARRRLDSDEDWDILCDAPPVNTVLARHYPWEAVPEISRHPPCCVEHDECKAAGGVEVVRFVQCVAGWGVKNQPAKMREADPAHMLLGCPEVARLMRANLLFAREVKKGVLRLEAFPCTVAMQFHDLPVRWPQFDGATPEQVPVLSPGMQQDRCLKLWLAAEPDLEWPPEVLALKSAPLRWFPAQPIAQAAIDTMARNIATYGGKVMLRTKAKADKGASKEPAG